MADVQVTHAIDVRASLDEVSVNAYRTFAVFARSHFPARVNVLRLAVRLDGPHCWITGTRVLTPVDCWLLTNGEWRSIGKFTLRVSGVAPRGEYAIRVELEVQSDNEPLPLILDEPLRFTVVDRSGCCG